MSLMCDYPNRETAMTPLRWDDNGTPTVWCDPCLVPLIEALNAGGIETVASCCGHNGNGSDGQQTDAPGWVMLRDGRTIVIYASHGRYLAASPPAVAASTGTSEDVERLAEDFREWYATATQKPPSDANREQFDRYLSAVLAALALPYADHPDYRESWRP